MSDDKEGMIDYSELSPELYEESPKGPGQGGGEPGEWHPDPELVDHPFYRAQYAEEFAELERRKGGSQEEKDPSAPLIIVNKLNGHEILRVPGYNRPSGYKECLQQFKGQLSLGIIEGDLSGDNVFLDRANFRDAQISASFKGAHLSEAVFDGAELEGCDFSGCDLRGSSFKGCDLSSCSFIGANLTMCDLRGATLPDKEKMASAIMNNIRM